MVGVAVRAIRPEREAKLRLQASEKALNALVFAAMKVHFAVGQPPEVRWSNPEQFARSREFAFPGFGDIIWCGGTAVVTLAAFAVAGAFDDALPSGFGGQRDGSGEAVGLVVRVRDEREERWHLPMVPESCCIE